MKKYKITSKKMNLLPSKQKLRCFCKALKLANKDSCICVDIHKPTDIDSLSKLVEKGANIYLFMYRKDNGKLPLMHAKFLLFEFANEQVEIWLGSQNFTASALEGGNIESTTIIRTSKSSKLYQQIAKYLEFIKNSCGDIGRLYKIGEKFNLGYVDFYKKLQGSFDFQEKPYQVMDIVCADVKELSDIYISHMKDGNYTGIVIYNNNIVKKINIEMGKDLLIRALDSNGSVVCYKSQIFNLSDGVTPTDEQTSDRTKSYIDRNGYRHKINTFIISRNNTIPVLVGNFSEETRSDVELVVQIRDKFTDILKISEKTNYWKNPKNSEKKDLSYLKHNGDKGLKIPKSPEHVRKESTYPFDKLKEQDIPNRTIMIENAKNDDLNEILLLDGKQSFIRKMATSEEKSEPDKKSSSKNNNKDNDSQPSLL